MTNKIIITLLLIEIALHLAEIAFDIETHYNLTGMLYG